MAFDTLTYVRQLKEAGFSDRQAEALAEATRDLAVQDFATSGDIAMLKADIAALAQRFTAAMDTLGCGSRSAWVGSSRSASRRSPPSSSSHPARARSAPSAASGLP